jgi:hypothetical protein
MPGLQYNYTMKLQMHVSCSKQSKHHALHFLYSVRVTRVIALLLYHLGMSARGLSCTGSKQQLVSRCFVAWESKTPLKFTEKQQLSRLQTEYDTRLKEANIDDPRSFKDEVWSH